jgi:hypothetical protein
MSWQQLLTDGRVETHQTSRQELNDLRSAVARNLADAAIVALSADNRFGIAYEASLLSAKMAIACAGYRVKGQGAHRTTFQALKLALGSSVTKTTGYLDRCRRKRNDLTYDAAGIVTEQDAEDLLLEAANLDRQIESWIAKHHSQFK